MQRTALTSAEREWFADANALTTRTSGDQPLDVEYAVIENRELEGAKLERFRFKDVTWHNMGADNTLWQDGTIEDSDVTNSDFRHATFRNVTFSNVHFKSVNLTASTMENVRFLNCSFDDVILSYLKGGKVVFDNAKFPERVAFDSKNWDFDGASIQLVFENTRLNWVAMNSFKSGSSLAFINSTVENGNIGHGHIDKIESKDSHLDMGGREMKVGAVTIQGGYTNIGFGGHVGTISISDTELNQLDLSETTVATVQVRQCLEPGDGSEAPGIQLGDRRAKMAGHAPGRLRSHAAVPRGSVSRMPLPIRLAIRDSDPSELPLKGATR